MELSPRWLESESGEKTMTVMGIGFEAGWEAHWNGQPRETKFVSQYQLEFQLLGEDTAAPGLAVVSIVNPATGQAARPAARVWVVVSVRYQDAAWDAGRERFWVATPGPERQPNPEIVLVNPANGWIEERLALPAEPKRLHLTDDGQFLYIALAKRFLRLRVAERSFDLDFPMPPTPAMSTPESTYWMTTEPGNPDRLIYSVRRDYSSPGYAGTVAVDAGIALPSQLEGREGPELFYGWLQSGQMVAGDENRLYLVRPGANGLRIEKTVNLPVRSGKCRLEAATLHCNSGLKIDLDGRISGGYLGRGPVYPVRERDETWFVEHERGRISRFRTSTGAPLGALLLPGFEGSPPNSETGELLRWGDNGFLWKNPPSIYDPAGRLYLFRMD